MDGREALELSSGWCIFLDSALSKTGIIAQPNARSQGGEADLEMNRVDQLSDCAAADGLSRLIKMLDFCNVAWNDFVN
ncbi:hypothetical protein MTR_5g061910 [Medicago truncatula]|uniref:Uncharacterized protein n=1 Tax=Medicago truncatula TaxID=3880 RepID=G7KA27_MEDTR|nr:hypothetical protein MTR_5g061910 [Medicago truncatula]